MSFDAEGFLSYRIANAEVHRFPFPHFFIQPAFPEDFYQRLLASLPATSVLTPIAEFGTVQAVEGGDSLDESQRYIADIATLEEDEERRNAGRFWVELGAWMSGQAFRQLILDKFSREITARFGPVSKLVTDIDTRYIRDFTRYAIAPHTDMPSKLVSLLFYLPRDTSMQHLGTSIYVPLNPALRCEGTARHRFDRFRRVATLPFVPNALLGFLKTDQSFHGVEEIDEPGVERNLLLYNIYVRKIVPRATSQSNGLWSRLRRRLSP
ncbi:MAG: hypothetical protein O2805_12720 [Proteobacteria bacterium]|nr:hypothetical protein [Pseudomonadota bacterium]